MKCADISGMDEKGVLALLLGAFGKNNSVSRRIEVFSKVGCIQKWLE